MAEELQYAGIPLRTALCGDLTCRGTPPELQALVACAGVLDIPAVADLGNHDCESDREDELQDILEDQGVGRPAATLDRLPVFNVARPVLRRHAMDLRIWSTHRTGARSAPDGAPPRA